ncbi:MAG: hypothetical protein AAFY24_26690, partial [Pseudomonadota bacterium]
MAAPAAPDPPAQPRPQPSRAKEDKRATSPFVIYGILALSFLVIGGGIGGIAHLISSGAISLSAPEETIVRTTGTPPVTDIGADLDGGADDT